MDWENEGCIPAGGYGKKFDDESRAKGHLWLLQRTGKPKQTRNSWWLQTKTLWKQNGVDKVLEGRNPASFFNAEKKVAFLRRVALLSKIVQPRVTEKTARAKSLLLFYQASSKRKLLLENVMNVTQTDVLPKTCLSQKIRRESLSGILGLPRFWTKAQIDIFPYASIFWKTTAWGLGSWVHHP